MAITITVADSAIFAFSLFPNFACLKNELDPFCLDSCGITQNVSLNSPYGSTTHLSRQRSTHCSRRLDPPRCLFVNCRPRLGRTTAPSMYMYISSLTVSRQSFGMVVYFFSAGARHIVAMSSKTNDFRRYHWCYQSGPGGSSVSSRPPRTGEQKCSGVKEYEDD